MIGMKYEEWKLEHEIYLKSPKWLLIRDKVLARDNETCQKCKKVGWVVHHLTYARWRNERLEDLITVCDDCHALIHLKKKNTKPKKNKPKFNKSSIKPKSSFYSVRDFIEKISRGAEFVKFDKSSRKLLYPHPSEILDHFGFEGETYQQKFDNITNKLFRKGDLIKKLQTMKFVMDNYYKKKNGSS